MLDQLKVPLVTPIYKSFDKNIFSIFSPDDNNLFYPGQDISKTETVVNEELVRVVEEWLKCTTLRLT